MQLTHTFTSEDGSEIELELNCHLDYNGIGSYEFHGQRCYDRGDLIMDECEIEHISGGSADHDYSDEAEKWVDDNWAEIEEKAVAKAAEERLEHEIEKAEWREDR